MNNERRLPEETLKRIRDHKDKIIMIWIIVVLTTIVWFIGSQSFFWAVTVMWLGLIFYVNENHSVIQSRNNVQIHEESLELTNATLQILREIRTELVENTRQVESLKNLLNQS